MFRIFRHYIPKALLFLGVSEFAILMASVYLGITLRFLTWDSTDVVYAIPFYDLMLPISVIFAMVMVIVMMAMGLYQRDLREGPLAILVRLGLSFLAGLMLMALIFYALPELVVGRGILGIALLCSFLGIVSCRFLYFQRTDEGLRSRALVLGVGEKAQMIARLRRRTDFRGMSIVGYVDIGNGQKVVNRSKFVQLGGMSLRQYVDAHEIDEIIVGLDERRNTVPINEILECKMKGVHVIDVQTFYERQLGKILLDSLHPSNLVFADGFTQAVLKPTSKRLFDILVSGALLILSLPIMVFVSVAINIESGGRGSIIYRQERVGKDGRVFEILKFRSMREDAEKDGIARWAKSNDTRVTKVGAFIRKTRLDELPQLINVLKGDMSIIGPRPERPQFVKELSADIPYYALRHYVKPGLTGWAQICYPYGASTKDAKEKLQYDLYYMKNYSLFLDLTILLETVQVIIWGKGAR